MTPKYRRRGRRRAALLAVFAAGLTLGFFAARELLLMDALVRERFEGVTFRVPSRVLAAPTILYPGLDFRQIDLRGALTRLGYREALFAENLAAGRYHWSAAQVNLHRRAFLHPSRSEPARRVRIALAGEKIRALHDADTGRELGALFLEPEQIGSYYGPRHQQRALFKLEDLPTHLIEAVVAVEDQRFWSHFGLDPKRIAGALVANVKRGGIAQGASTLTQQLAKNFFLTHERTFSRKAREAVMALLMEARYSKPRILEAYLNEIYLGQRGGVAIHGVGEAARLYFGKRASTLALHEAALLAGIIQSPRRFSPHTAPAAAKRQRNLVLRLMLRQGRTSQIAYENARAQPLAVSKVTPEPPEARYFLEALRRQLPEFYARELLESEGLELYSTLDLRMQRAASRVLEEELSALEAAHPQLRAGDAKLQGCLLALRPQTGELLALAGGRNYADSQFDRCTQARRPAGSVFKPFVYLTALTPPAAGARARFTLASFLDDTALEVRLPRGAPQRTWAPRNFSRKFHGRVPLRRALEHSYNVATARLGQEVGIARVAATARRLGISSELPAVPSLAIGTADVTPLEIARAYATLANGGIRPRIRTFEDIVAPGAPGVAERQPIRFERAIGAGPAYLMVSLLEGVVARGTARGLARFGVTGALAGKTGTSSEERDAWFVGFTPELVVVVWVGFDAPRSLGLASSRVALPVWASFVREVTGGHVRGQFAPPPEVVEREVHPATGALAKAGCPERRREWFLVGSEPARECPETEASGEGAPPTRENFLQRLFGG